MKNHLELKVTYEGQLQQIDVDTLITSLLHLAEMLKSISAKVMPSERLRINIVTTEKGSFSVLLELSQAASTFFNTFFGTPVQSLDTIANIIEILIALLALKKFLKGKTPDNLINQNNGCVIIIINKSEMVVHDNVFRIYSSDQEANDHIENLFEKLSENSEIEGLEIDGNIAGSFRAERKDFSELAKTNEMLESEESKEPILNVEVAILKLVFQKSRKWEFIYQGNKISAHIVDNNFWNQVDSGHAQFAKGDILTVDLEVTKAFDHDVNCMVNKAYKVTKVSHHQPRAQQNQLFPNEE
ncbi:MAG: hypothetical protein HPY50_00375 [Firmicutes bacterium]|nr:hypothetical protein [Bacillota bacterium]